MNWLWVKRKKNIFYRSTQLESTVFKSEKNMNTIQLENITYINITLVVSKMTLCSSFQLFCNAALNGINGILTHLFVIRKYEKRHSILASAQCVVLVWLMPLTRISKRVMRYSTGIRDVFFIFFSLFLFFNLLWNKIKGKTLSSVHWCTSC